MKRVFRTYVYILYICIMKQDIRIKEICKEKGITLEDLAKRLGILRTSLSQALSRNSFSTDKLSEIADALNVPIWQLFVSPNEVAGGGEELTAFVSYRGECFSTHSKEELKEYVNDL